MKAVKIFFLVFISLAFTNVADVKLQYQFKVGDQFVWVQDTKQAIKQTIMGNEQTIDNVYQTESTLKVVELTSTGAKIECTYTKLRNIAKTPMGENGLDSEGPADKYENKLFKAMTNKPFYIYLSKNGTVEKLENTQNLWSALGEAGGDPQKQKAMRGLLEMTFGDEQLKSQIQSSLVTYSGNKVKKGDKWTTNHTMKTTTTMTVESTWNVESLSGNTANLFCEGTLSTVDKEKVFEIPGNNIKAKSDLAGKHAVKATVDTKTGWASKSEHLTETKGVMTLLAGGVIPQDMEMPMEVVSESTYTLTKK